MIVQYPLFPFFSNFIFYNVKSLAKLGFLQAVFLYTNASGRVIFRGGSDLENKGNLEKRSFRMAHSTPMMERMGMGMPGMPAPAMGMAGPGTMPAMPPSMNWMMVPRCTFKIEKCKGGMKITCVCDDPMACTMVQNLCSALAGGMCTCCMMMNGMMVCCCNLTMGMCSCEATSKGVCLTCTS